MEPVRDVFVDPGLAKDRQDGLAKCKGNRAS
jgi:hypothetical protein